MLQLGLYHYSYGIILFSYTGFSILPELDFKKSFKLSIFISYIIITIIYSLFATIQDPSVNRLLYSFTVIYAIATSYIPLTIALENTLYEDLKIHPIIAKTISILSPWAVIILGGKNFLTLFSITGGVFIAVLQILIILAFLKKEKRKITTRILSCTILLLLFLGIIAVVFENI